MKGKSVIMILAFNLSDDDFYTSLTLRYVLHLGYEHKLYKCSHSLIAYSYNV